MWTPHRFYSQNFEDLYLHRLFSCVNKGFYVDIGAADPHMHSVTACFYQQGWRGINVEPVAESYASLCQYRPEDTNLNVAISGSSNSLVEIAVYGDSPGNAGHHRVYTGNQIQSPVSYSAADKVESRAVDATTLRSIFDSYVCNQSVNFLKIDIEGKEFEALHGLDFPTLSDHQRPEVILLEVTIPFTKLDAPHREKCRLLLESSDYKHLFFDGLNDYFCLNSLFDRFKPLMLPPNIFDVPSFLPQQDFGQLFSDSELHPLKINEQNTRIDQLTQDVSCLSQLLGLKEEELQTVTADRDSKVQQNALAQKSVDHQTQKFSMKCAELETERKEKAVLAERLKSLEEELIVLKAEGQEKAVLAERLKSLEEELTDVKGERDAREMDAIKARDEAELTYLQLHQVQEELERYFLESCEQSDLLRQHQTQSLAMRQAIAKFLAAQI